MPFAVEHGSIRNPNRVVLFIAVMFDSTSQCGDADPLSLEA